MKNSVVFDGGAGIESLIYEIRGRQVMLDSDLARLYGCKNGTKTINLAVRRHIDRFPEDFCFQLDEEELGNLRSQVVTANEDAGILRSQVVTSKENGLRFQIGASNGDTGGLRSQVGTANGDDPLRFQVETSKDVDLRFQVETAKNQVIPMGRHNMSRSNPYVFTEQGVAMLATILRTDVAARVSIAIMRAFVAMKKYIPTSLIEQQYINEMVIKNDKRLSLVEEALAGFDEKANHLFFDGQIYDAYSIMKDILEKSEKEIIIIDNYIDKNLLDILAKIERKVILVTNKYNNHDYNKYKKQYSNVELMVNNNIHDRFIVIDRKILYHCGASFKDLGKKCFGINRIDDGGYLVRLLELVKCISSNTY